MNKETVPEDAIGIRLIDDDLLWPELIGPHAPAEERVFPTPLPDFARTTPLESSFQNPVSAVGPGNSAALVPPPDQWYLRYNPSAGNHGINVAPAWNDYTGAGVKVAVFDTGVDRLHTDLSANFSVPLSMNAHTNFVGGGAGVPLAAGDNHGTFVAGLIAGENLLVGVAYDATLISEYGTMFLEDTPTEAPNAFNHSAVHADVMNNSWSYGNLFLRPASSNPQNSAFAGNFKLPELSAAAAAFAHAGLDGRNGLGTVIVTAAGNARGFGDDTNLDSFRNSPFTITVAGTLRDGSIAGYSSPGASILVSAPGGGGSTLPEGILSTDRTGSEGHSNGDYYVSSGTSAAAPQVAGIAALMLQANPQLGNVDVQEILAYSARQTGAAASFSFNGAHDWNGGGLHTSPDYGFGLVDARAAVRLAEVWTLQENISSATQSTRSQTHAVNQAIPDNTDAGTSYSFTLPFGIVFRVKRIDIDLNVTHTAIGDLTVALTSPAGTVSTLVNRPGVSPSAFFGSSQDNIDFVFDSVQFWGENEGGTWTIKVADRAFNDIGTFNSFRVTVYDEADMDDHYVYTDEYAVFAGISGHSTTLAETDGGIDALDAAAVTTSSIINLNAGSTSTIAGKPLTIAAGSAIENAFGGDGDDIITGNSVSNILWGGRGDDAFVSGPGSGADTIKDLVAGAGTPDKINLTAFSNIHTLADLLGRATHAGTDTVIDFGNGDTLTLQNVQKASLRADDFILTPKTSFVSAGSWTGAGNDAQGWYVGDFNNDGRDDIFRHNAGVSGAEVFLSNGSSAFGFAGSWTGAGNDAQGWYVGDFNGDNRDDIFRYNAGVSGAQVFLSNGSSAFDFAGSWTGAGNDAQGWYVGDFNGDGKDDIFRHNAGVSGAEVFLSNGSAFVSAGSWTGAGNGSDGQWYLGDFNGDGKTDIFRYLAGQSGADVFLSNGSAFVSAGSWTGAGKGTDGRWHIGDYDGDGTGDLLRYLAGFSGAEVLL